MLTFLSYKIVVYCDSEEEQINRLLKRNPNYTVEDAKLRINSQMSTKDKLKIADYSIDNSNDLDYTKKQIDNLYKIFSSSKKHIYVKFALSIIFGCLATFFRKILF